MFKWIKSLIEIAVIFIFVKFLIFPLAAYALGVETPVVAVVSGSMEHHYDIDTWWLERKPFYDKKNISEEQFWKFPFHNGFNTGSIMLLKNSKNISKGDIIVFKSVSGEYIIHRIVQLSPLETKGDANYEQIPGTDTIINSNQIIGEAWINIPYLGYPKVFMNALINKFI